MAAGSPEMLVQMGPMVMATILMAHVVAVAALVEAAGVMVELAVLLHSET